MRPNKRGADRRGSYLARAFSSFVVELASAPALRLEAVRKEYARGVVALQSVSLDVRAGELLAVIGASGSGKSSLLALAGLMDHPSSGRVLHRGVDLSRAPERARERERLLGIGFVFQHFYLVPTLTAEENVALPLKAAGVRSVERKARLDSLFASVDLEARRGHLPHEMSGGEQQRVAVARALANKPYLLLADEPTGELDPESGARVMALIAATCQAQGTAVALVTHDRGLIPRGARVVELAQGVLQREVIA